MFSSKVSETKVEVDEKDKECVLLLSDALLPNTSDALQPNTSDALLPSTSDALLPSTSDALLPSTFDALLPSTSDALLPSTFGTERWRSSQDQESGEDAPDLLTSNTSHNDGMDVSSSEGIGGILCICRIFQYCSSAGGMHWWSAMFLIVNAAIGPGLLHFPLVFSKAGLLSANLMHLIFIVAIIGSFKIMSTIVAKNNSKSYEQVFFAVGSFAGKCICTYPVQMFCIREAIFSVVGFQQKTPEEKESVTEIASRIILVCVVWLVTLLSAIYFPDINVAVKLLGSLSSAFIFVFPGLCYLMHTFTLEKKDGLLRLKMRFVAIFYVVLGSFMFVYSFAIGVKNYISSQDDGQVPICGNYAGNITEIANGIMNTYGLKSYSAVQSLRHFYTGDL